MKATDLYNQLESDFVKPEIIEEWYNDDWGNKEYICDNFKKLYSKQVKTVLTR